MIEKTPVEAPETSVGEARPEAPEAIPEDEKGAVRRIVRCAIGAWLVAALGYALARQWWGLAGLTCSAGVVIINFLWLESIVSVVLQPAPRVKAWRLGVRALARFTLFGAALAISIFVVRFNPLSVLIGFSVLVIGIGCEVLYAVYGALRGAS